MIWRGLLYFELAKSSDMWNNNEIIFFQNDNVILAKISAKWKVTSLQIRFFISFGNHPATVSFVVVVFYDDDDGVVSLL